MKKYNRIVEIDSNIIQLTCLLDQRDVLDDCRVVIYSNNGASHFSWWDKRDAARDINKLIAELTKLKEKVQ